MFGLGPRAVGKLGVSYRYFVISSYKFPTMFLFALHLYAKQDVDMGRWVHHQDLGRVSRVQ